MNLKNISKLLKIRVKQNRLKKIKRNPLKLVSTKYFSNLLKELTAEKYKTINKDNKNIVIKKPKKINLLNKNIVAKAKIKFKLKRRFRLKGYVPWWRRKKRALKRAKTHRRFRGNYKLSKHLLKLRSFKHKNILTIHVRCTRNNTFIVATKRNYIFNKLSERRLKPLKKSNESNIFLKKMEEKEIVYKYKKRVLKILKPHITRSTIVAWNSAGTSGFKGNKKGLPYAAQTAATILGIKIKRKQYRKIRGVRIKMRGKGKGRFTVLKGLRIALRNRISMLSIERIKANPHNGCRKKKKRRV